MQEYQKNLKHHKLQISLNNQKRPMIKRKKVILKDFLFSTQHPVVLFMTTLSEIKLLVFVLSIMKENKGVATIEL